MTKLNKPISRVTENVLGSSFGSDRGRRLVITIIPSHGEDGPTFKLKPEKCRDGRAEYISVEQVYRYAIICRVNGAKMKRLREIKEKKQAVRKDREARRGFKRQ